MMLIFQWDVGVSYKRDPIVLSGGYSEWLDRYPALTTNPKVSPKHSPDLSDDLISLGILFLIRLINLSKRLLLGTFV
jgi:hypothetical protein